MLLRIFTKLSFHEILQKSLKIRYLEKLYKSTQQDRQQVTTFIPCHSLIAQQNCEQKCNTLQNDAQCLFTICPYILQTSSCRGEPHKYYLRGMLPTTNLNIHKTPTNGHNFFLLSPTLYFSAKRLLVSRAFQWYALLAFLAMLGGSTPEASMNLPLAKFLQPVATSLTLAFYGDN